MPTLGTNIRALRHKHGLSQQDMADKLGMTRAGYGNIELGRSCPSSKRLEQIAAIFGVWAGSLLPRKQKNTPEPRPEVVHV
jgi:transcriptional regulator with XRE-family HTH domain